MLSFINFYKKTLIVKKIIIIKISRNCLKSINIKLAGENIIQLHLNVLQKAKGYLSGFLFFLFYKKAFIFIDVLTKITQKNKYKHHHSICYKNN